MLNRTNVPKVKNYFAESIKCVIIIWLIKFFIKTFLYKVIREI